MKTKNRGGRPPIKAIRWSLHQASQEFAVTVDRIKRGLKANGVQSDAANTYSTHQIATAIYGFDGLEKQAKEAKMRKQIDEAEMVKNQRELQEGTLIGTAYVKEFLMELKTMTAQGIRHSHLSDKEKRDLLTRFREVKFEPNKKVAKRFTFQ
jgi:hypothetical protein